MTQTVWQHERHDVISGNHLCFFYQSSTELYHILSTNLNQENQSNERTLLFARSEFKSEIAEHLLFPNQDGSSCFDQGSLRILPAENLVRDTGEYDPAEVISVLQREVDWAREDGYAGIRGIAVLEWLASKNITIQSWVRIEKVFNDFRLTQPCSFLCCLNMGSFHHSFRIQFFYQHPEVLVDDGIQDNLYYNPAAITPEGHLPARFFDTLLQSVTFHNLDERNFAYRQIAKNLPGIVYRLVLGKEHRIHFINRNTELVTGYSEDELLSERICPILDLIVEEDRERVEAVVQEALTAGRTFSTTYRLRRKDGSTAVILEQGTPVFGTGKERVCIDGFLSDITEQRRAEETIRIQAQILSHIPDPIVSTDLDAYIQTWNAGAERFYGYSEEEALGRHVSFLYPKDQHEFLEQEIIAKLLSFGPHRVEAKIATKSGEIKFVDLTLALLRDERNDVSGMLGYTRDITKEKQARESMQSYIQQMKIMHQMDEAILSKKSPQEIEPMILENLRQLIPCIRTSISLFDEDNYEGVILAVDSDVATAIQPGTRFPSHFDHQDIQNFHEDEVHYVTDTLNINSPSPIEKMLFKEGVRSYMAVPIFTSDRLIGSLNFSANRPDAFSPEQIELAHKVASSLAVAIQDAQLIELLKLSRARMRKLTQKTVEVQEAERQRISRELHDQAGQALTALRISLDLVRSQLPQEYTSLHEELDQAAQLTSKTMNEIRLLAADLRPPEIDTIGLQAALEDLCQDITRRTRIDIYFSSPDLPDLPDAQMISMYRIVQEALTNVIKHSIALHAWVTIELMPSWLVLKIRDDGCGFPVKQTLNASAAKSGLGILGMIERVELLGGVLKIDSLPGTGTTITIKIPWRDQP